MSREKLYLVTRDDLPACQQAVQAIHAALEFSVKEHMITKEWMERSNHVALLSVPSEDALFMLVARAADRGVDCVSFHEPDRGNELTAVAFEPGREARRLLRRLGLALREARP